ncbi:MAG: hypothetical protein ACR2MD_04065 [Aridibacter sp.]
MTKITRRELLKSGGAGLIINGLFGCGKNLRKQPKIYRNSGEAIVSKRS